MILLVFNILFREFCRFLKTAAGKEDKRNDNSIMNKQKKAKTEIIIPD